MSKRIINGVIFSVIFLFIFAFIILPLNYLNNGSDFLIKTFETTTQEGVVACHKMYGFLNVASKEQRTNIGGFPVAMALFTDGVIIEDTAPVETPFGRVKPAIHLKRGDFITELDGIKVKCGEDIENIISSKGSKAMLIKVLRSGEEKTFEICPAKEEFSNKYRLGLVIRDYLLGVGMVSYINEDGSFAALGHPITDSVAGKVPIRSGKVFSCQQIGVTKGERGVPGELRVKLDAGKRPIGEIYKCCDSGVYGKLYNIPKTKNYPIANRKNVKAGEAYIYTDMDGGKPEFYKIEIIRAVSQNDYADKGIIFRVTDSRLLSLTGGIVQGMSGSPIVQNNRIIGAVTHVFINDPTKGYGIYMDFMHEKNE